MIDTDFDLETVDDTNLSTTTDADFADSTTLNVSSQQALRLVIL